MLIACEAPTTPIRAFISRSTAAAASPNCVFDTEYRGDPKTKGAFGGASEFESMSTGGLGDVGNPPGTSSPLSSLSAGFETVTVGPEPEVILISSSWSYPAEPNPKLTLATVGDSGPSAFSITASTCAKSAASLLGEGEGRGMPERRSAGERERRGGRTGDAISRTV